MLAFSALLLNAMSWKERSVAESPLILYVPGMVSLALLLVDFLCQGLILVLETEKRAGNVPAPFLLWRDLRSDL